MPFEVELLRVPAGAEIPFTDELRADYFTTVLEPQLDVTADGDLWWIT